MSERRAAWEIADDMVHAFDQETGEVDQEHWDTLELELGEKAEAIHSVLCWLGAESNACRDEEKRLAARRKATDAKADRLRGYLMDCLHVAGIDKLRTPTLTASVRRGKERVEVVDVGLLAPGLIRVKREADKVAIKEALERGEEVVGATLVRGPDDVQFK